MKHDKIGIWNVNCTQITAYISDWRMDEHLFERVNNHWRKNLILQDSTYFTNARVFLIQPM